ncbi:MAG: nickel-responsive transcriptional regulator NikR [Proteobacteria bacterium]|nr:nickel-responsive transcriptional regulator NikR [Pseudomonadota bacterium]
MQKITRFGVSIDQKLLEHFDEKISSEGYLNRSEAIRDLIRESLVEKDWKLGDEEMIGVVSLVFSHAQRELTEALTEIQHHHYPSIISAVHIHLDHDHCLEVLILKGKGKKIRMITDELKILRGVKHCQLSISTTGKELP